jgi:hypothetical protein
MKLTCRRTARPMPSMMTRSAGRQQCGWGLQFYSCYVCTLMGVQRVPKQFREVWPIPVPTVASATAADTRLRSRHGLPCPVATTNRGATLHSAAKSSSLSEVHGMLCSCMANRLPEQSIQCQITCCGCVVKEALPCCW